MQLHPITIELDLMQPPQSAPLNGSSQRRLNEAGEGCLDPKASFVGTPRLDQPQRKLVPVVPLMALDEVLNAGRHVPQLQIAAPAQLMGNVFRDVLRPAFGCVEGDDPDRVLVLAGRRRSATSRSVTAISAGATTQSSKSSFTR